MEKIKPIIVIGMNRSGTKWLSNILSNHPDIISVRHERGKGIQETNMFSIFPKAFGDLSDPNKATAISNYVALIECWSRTDFFKLTNTDKEFFYKLRPRPTNYFKIFRILMDDFAGRNNKKYWLQKTNPYNGLKCLQHYSDGYFILIKRDIIDTIKSAVQQRFNLGETGKSLLREIFAYIQSEKILNTIHQSHSVVFLNYEDLKSNPDVTVKHVCDYIGIEFRHSLLDVPFKKNTSFQSDIDRNKILTKPEIILIKIISTILRIFPLFVFSVAYSIFEKKTTAITPGTFGYITDNYYKDILNVDFFKQDKNSNKS